MKYKAAYVLQHMHSRGSNQVFLHISFIQKQVDWFTVWCQAVTESAGATGRLTHKKH